MNTILVTSRVTVVPRNYNALVAGLASCPQISGLMILDNRSRRLLFNVLGLALAGAPRIGWTFLRNRYGASDRLRRHAFAEAGKPVWTLPDINHPAALAVLNDPPVDLLLNARTRYRYGAAILQAPRLGCLNIHHGLLPDQRGTLCDLWALYERQPAGFSIHHMTPAIDAGPILWRETVSDGSDRHYPAYLLNASRRERTAVSNLLASIEANGLPAGDSNQAPPGITMRRNPTPRQVRAMRRSGLRL